MSRCRRRESERKIETGEQFASTSGVKNPYLPLMKQWFYSLNGQQLGPVDFSEIERLRVEGQLTDDSLVWQEGTPAWIKLSQVMAMSRPPGVSGAPILPLAQASSLRGSVLPDYGDILCWGFIGVILPCLGLVVFVALIVLHGMEFLAARKEVEAGRLSPSSYSRMSPVLFFLGLICCGGLLYPLFMHYRNLSGYFKPQPHAVWVSIVVVVLTIGVNVILQFASTFLQAATNLPN